MTSGLDLDSLRELLELLKEFNVTNFSKGDLTLAISCNLTYTSQSKSNDGMKQERQLTDREREVMAALPPGYVDNLFQYTR